MEPYIIFNRKFPLHHPVDENFWCFIRLLDGEDIIIGTVSYRQTGQITKIRDIEIHKQYQGKGFGTEILQTILEQAERSTSILVKLFVFDHRSVAKHVYTKLGFEIDSVFDNGVSMYHTKIHYLG